MAEDIRMTKLAECAGCGAKVGAGVLAKLLKDLPVRRDDRLLVGFDTSDDASVYKISDDLALVQTIDFFPPIVDDPYTFGQIAAANAISDIYAMGAEPKLALNVMTVSKAMSDDAVHAVLRGGYEKAYEAGVIITGGHTIQDREPKYGLAVTGFGRPDRILLNSRALPGDVLILTKPLGIGVITTANKAGLAPAEVYARAVKQMAELNKTAAETAAKYTIHGCTDITGFALIGHSTEMARGSGTTVVLDHARVPVLPEAQHFAELGLLPEGMYRNRHFAEATTRADAGVARSMLDVMYDPQTSGGLLLACAEQDAAALLAELKDKLECAEAIGHVAPNEGCDVHVI